MSKNGLKLIRFLFVILSACPLLSCSKEDASFSSDTSAAVIENAQSQSLSQQFSFVAPQNTFISCLDDIEELKTVNSTCQKDADCFGFGVSTVCKGKKCSCRDGHVPEERQLAGGITDVVCVQAPYLFQPCSTQCQKPFVCKNFSDTQQHPFPSITGKVCQCLTPFKFDNGLCYLECKSDEYFFEDQCLKKCQLNEVRLKDLRCLPLLSLGSSCEADDQCFTFYSECNNGVCKCRPGFKENNSSCQALSITCPVGEPLSNKSSIMQCKTNRLFSPFLVTQTSKAEDQKNSNPDSPTSLFDTCPSTHFCLPTNGEQGVERASGHCCPKPTVTCPLGAPHTSAICLVDPEGVLPYCPGETHFCFGVAVGAYSEQICCPKSCADGFVLSDGKCYPQVSFGDECNVDGQCNGHNGMCSSGKCICPKNMKPTGSKVYPICQTECGVNEVLYENQCYPRLKISDSCNVTTAWRCPLNSLCKKNKCSCLCGMYKLNDNLCGPVPFCNNELETKKTFSRVLKDFSPKEVFSNTTFCKVADQKSLLTEAVDTCPSGQYCSAYMLNLGQCCNKPDPKCPNGQKVESSIVCDPSNPLSCGQNKFCYRNLVPADPQSRDGFICCPLERPVFVPVQLPPPLSSTAP